LCCVWCERGKKGKECCAKSGSQINSDVPFAENELSALEAFNLQPSRSREGKKRNAKGHIPHKHGLQEKWVTRKEKVKRGSVFPPQPDYATEIEMTLGLTDFVTGKKHSSSS
jgi:hypothetical protein